MKSSINLRLQVDTGKNELLKHAKLADSILCKAMRHLNWINSKGKKLNSAIAEKKKKKQKKKKRFNGNKCIQCLRTCSIINAQCTMQYT